MLKKLLVALLLVAISSGIAFGVSAIKEWRAYDIEVTGIHIVKHGDNVDISAGYYFLDDTGEVVGGVNLGRFVKATVPIANLPADLKQAILTLRSYVRQEVLRGIETP